MNWRCPYCGSTNAATDRSCPGCGCMQQDVPQPKRGSGYSPPVTFSRPRSTTLPPFVPLSKEERREREKRANSYECSKCGWALATGHSHRCSAIPPQPPPDTTDIVKGADPTPIIGAILFGLSIIYVLIVYFAVGF